jgi:hypothetical protein
MKKTPAVWDGWGLNTRNKPGRLGWGLKNASGIHNFDPSAVLNLYKIAHWETAVDKWNNSASVSRRVYHAASSRMMR